MTQTELLPESTTMRPERDGCRWDMVLIQVPEVRVRPTRIASSRVRRPSDRFGRPVGTRRPRRRLRREIRMAAFAGLAFAPLLLAAGVWTLPPPRPLAAAEVAAVVEAESTTPAAVLISIEPAGGAFESESESPVVFPGYLLPDDHREEPAHEGS